MTVNPGFGGQKFIEHVLPKIKKCRELLNEKGLTHIDVEVDGGVNPETAEACRLAGANVLVAGSAIFNAVNRREAISAIRG